MSAAPAVCSVRDLGRTYPMGRGRVDALAGVDLDLLAGEYLAIMGPSGSGKSTLLHLLGCLDRPTRGSYVLDGVDVSGLGDRGLSRLRRSKIGFVFQTFHLIETLDVLGNVELPFLYGDVPAGEARRRALAAIERVGLAARAEHRPGELSGGEMQRVAIARALVIEPRLVLADEPTGNLDSHTGASILELFDELHATGVSLVVVTHDPEVAARAGRRLRLVDGRVAEEPDAGAPDGMASP